MTNENRIIEILHKHTYEVDNLNDAVFTGNFESVAQEIVKLFAIPFVSKRFYAVINSDGQAVSYWFKKEDAENDADKGVILYSDEGCSVEEINVC